MKKKRSAFTLLEMIITLAITVIIISIAGSMVVTGNKVFSDSDVKSTLQIEGQDIQEKLSDIGMQGIEITSEEPLIVKSYLKGNDTTPRYFKIGKNKNSNLIINQDIDSSCSDEANDQIISRNLKTLQTIVSDNGKSINFNIVLTRKQGFSNVDHEIKFTIYLRNKVS
ncbi:type II secretion system protein [Clostridium saccharoperbutylacetonicum]|uniref:type II secretion system protein n=1 Tax=Clostridium saccharoperbutylacetonicum TaxID=36745 RepID=UPI0039E947D3